MKSFILYLMAGFLILAGILHLVKPRFFLQIMPPYIPYHLAMVYLSGIAELALGIGLCFPATQSWAAYGVIALLLAVLPANVYMWQAHIPFNGKVPPEWVYILRIPIQFVLMYVAYLFT